MRQGAWLRNDTVLRVIIVLAWLPVVLRCLAECINSATGTSLPVIADKGLTFFFTLFSLGHAARMLGWKRALSFSGCCVVVSWCFEATGVRTGLVYGAYHYGDVLGMRVAGVPVLIPFAWFMMVYPSWIVAHLLLQDAAPVSSWKGIVARAFGASVVMTVWDTIMDPTMAAQGNWTWERPGMYFGVPVQNFVGWLATTLTLYLVAGVLFRSLRAPVVVPAGRAFVSLAVVAYLFVAVARCFVASPPQLRVFAAFSMVVFGALALLRLLLVPQALCLVDPCLRQR